ncbi:hypothetical protein GH865_09085 [Rhodocyclus tenuis]|uniref:hypothetical protein n=1 Tax=Rhodocyclus gracilis TaxID=2929842 RepID=UPI001298D78B|nr:hypothetical protein [Rhodocyclus gracilis]MRD73397.1 hypothetical protein [Rhodocyclus gracilis]
MRHTENAPLRRPAWRLGLVGLLGAACWAGLGANALPGAHSPNTDSAARGTNLTNVFSVPTAAAAELVVGPITPPQSMEDAQAMHQRAEALRSENERRYAAEKDACYSRFLMNACLEDAKKAFTAASIAIRPLDQMARDFEREHRRAEIQAKDAQRAQDAERRAVDEREQAARYRAEEARRAAEREQHLAEKAAQAEEGRRKTLAEEADRRERDAERARHRAEREAKKAEGAP